MNDRIAAHEKWVTEVRNPATAHSEGLRSLNVDGAKAEYEIASLPDGRFAVRISMMYQCGDHSGHARPWTTFATRQECVDYFLERASQHFEQKHSAANIGDRQQRARRQTLDLLQGGLFGFMEPDVAR